MCIEALDGGTNRRPHYMKEVSKVVFEYLSTENPNEEGLLGYLKENYDKHRIQKCGCNDRDFKLHTTKTGYKVIMNSSDGMLYVITVTDTDYSYELSSFSEAIDDYDDIVYREFTD